MIIMFIMYYGQWGWQVNAQMENGELFPTWLDLAQCREQILQGYVATVHGKLTLIGSIGILDHNDRDIETYVYRIEGTE